MADYYKETPDWEDEWPPPDGYKTGRHGESMAEFSVWCAHVWPGVPMTMAGGDSPEN